MFSNKKTGTKYANLGILHRYKKSIQKKFNETTGVRFIRVVKMKFKGSKKKKRSF